MSNLVANVEDEITDNEADWQENQAMDHKASNFTAFRSKSPKFVCRPPYPSCNPDNAELRWKIYDLAEELKKVNFTNCILNCSPQSKVVPNAFELHFVNHLGVEQYGLNDNPQVFMKVICITEEHMRAKPSDYTAVPIILSEIMDVARDDRLLSVLIPHLASDLVGHYLGFIAIA